MRAWREKTSWGTRRGACARRASSSIRRRTAGGADGEPHDHAHPHQHSDPAGAVHRDRRSGAVRSALGLALTRAGWPITAVASRDPPSGGGGSSAAPGVRWGHAASRRGGADRRGMPDDAIEPLARSIRLYSGQALVHTSGGRSRRRRSSEPAMAAGGVAGSIRCWSRSPTRSRAVAAVPRRDDRRRGRRPAGCPARRRGPPAIREARAVRLAPGDEGGLSCRGGARRRRLRRPARRDRRARPGSELDETGALSIYGPLIEQTLGNARALGIRAALTGPMTRGDVGTLEAHLRALANKHTGCPAAVSCGCRTGDPAGRGAWRTDTGTFPKRLPAPPLQTLPDTGRIADMQHSIAAKI